MTAWLDPVRSALDETQSEVPFFFRDDDAGWDDEGLCRLLDRCETNAVHIDVAVIPGELNAPLAATMCERAAAGLVHLHQHGFRHVNHETNGRKYEFGPSRCHDQQLADIAEGQSLLETLQPYVEPIFTPPWNRCTDDTAAALANLGFRILSRDSTADPLVHDGLTQVPVTVDWFGKTKGELSTLEQIGHKIAYQIADGVAPIGIMLHHAVTDSDHLTSIDQLLSLVAAHPNAASTSIYNSSF